MSSPKRSEARERLRRTAAELFYREGINSVGVDRIIDAAGVTRATFYRHFPGKESLVLAYLNFEDSTLRAQFGSSEDRAPLERIDAMITGIAEDIALKHSRGCPFINAAAEYHDSSSPVRQTIAAHRAWFRDMLDRTLASTGRPDHAEIASALVLLRDGALVGGYLDGQETMRDAFIHTARAVAGLEPARRE